MVGQWVVYDPSVHAQTVLNGAQDLAKFVEVINNQVSQIEKLQAQLASLDHYIDLFGNPAKASPGALKSLSNDLRKSEVGQTFEAIEAAADGAEAFSAIGIFHSIGESFSTPGEKKVERTAEAYKPVVAIRKATENFAAVISDASQRRVELKAQIATTTDELKGARTDAEVQKLNGTLFALNAALESTDQEIHQAVASTIVQDIANRNDAERQERARKEEQQAEFAEAAENYTRKFRLLTDPVRFPRGNNH